MSNYELIKNEELILTALASGSELYGLEIIKLIEEASEGEILINYGSLYPLLNKLAKKGYVKSYWEDENARKGARRRYYQITNTGIDLFKQSQNLRERLRKLATKSKLNIPLEIFEFETVTVDSYGKIVQRKSKQVQYYTEQLPNGVSLEMVYIPGDSFRMGSLKGLNYKDRSYREGWEFPQNLVTVADFYMGKYPITQEQWEAVASLPRIKQNINIKPSSFPGKQNPIEKVSWNDVREFCQRLAKFTDKQYQLPSEAQWEYACRAGTTTPFYFGETITGNLANYDASKTFAKENPQKSTGQTTPVGSFIPNNFGLYNMHGNVWEWCADDWHKNYKYVPKDETPWISRKSNNKVLRGGSWDADPGYCRSATRFDSNAEDDFNSFGFRVVCEVPRTTK